ncbi:MAG TPA: UDP-N-acetylglucosamine 2-epimerase (non-hydrolyzing) [Anaerolineales bacterium]|nr:UDP-N-acetylglucosamine 2-epimerase (non-hydrolyzing) [Anaerolineales bacterium]
MKALSILAIFGTRPEAIKMAPVVKQLERYPEKLHVQVCVTGQHRQMLDQVLSLFSITPDYDFNLMQANQTPNYVASQVLHHLDTLLGEVKPDWILVQGDTTTVMAAAIAAHNRRVKVGHVEAGLRTYDRNNPFPEEMNRVVTDHISDLHFAPTPQAARNLLQEGIRKDSIHITGNTVIDALQWVVRQPATTELEQLLYRVGVKNNNKSEGAPAQAAAAHSPTEKSLILVTAHRRENFGQPIRDICRALQLLSERGDVHIVYPVHMNPNIREPVHELLGSAPGITLLAPVDYLTLAHLMKHSRLILTDSGGIQEEAPTLGVPVLVLREATERPEAVKAGAACLVGTDAEQIFSQVQALLEDATAYNRMSKAVNPYGDGLAAHRIAQVLMEGNCQPFQEEQLG